MTETNNGTDAESTYECLDCGQTVVATEQPIDCPNCASTLRNRSTSLE